ncbi:hypothetical protein [Mycobacterium sp. TY815]|uniref:hypothetical protein n=1 Tax=Mycobacterium sp. TY815 TaxID=3050581 RepID=UPI0027423E77|nr:hypothetical protein [Mycobacterium sp. TY815]MDP7706823.1 hypothetical protein [Mycobacterium sp. TY815]
MFREIAERAVEALKSIAESLGTLATTADLQAEVLTQHQHHVHHPRPEPAAQPLRSVTTEDRLRG